MYKIMLKIREANGIHPYTYKFMTIVNESGLDVEYVTKNRY